MRVQAQNERTITQIQATVTKLLFVHTHTTAYETSFSECLCDLDIRGYSSVAGQANKRASLTIVKLGAALAAKSAWTQAV